MRILRTVLLPTLVVGALCAGVAAAVAGREGLLGSLVGTAIVVLFLGSTPVVMGPTAKVSAAMALPVAIGFYTAKALAVAVLVALLLDPDGVGSSLDLRALGASVAVVSITWSSLHLRAFSRNRVPTYDLGNNP